MEWYVFFPYACSANMLTSLLKNYGGLEKDQIAMLRGLPSRWVAFRKTFPMAYVYEGGAGVLVARPGDEPGAVGAKAPRGVKRARAGTEEEDHADD